MNRVLFPDQKSSTRRAAIWFFFLAVLGLYTVWLSSFTVFDGLSTLSNDAPSYLLLAKKWSPYFAPGLAETVNWPVHNYPPAFPALLALSGVTESTRAAHVFVTACLLLGLVLFSWMSRSGLGWKFGALLTVSVVMLPGAVVHSIGILSENLYFLVSLLVLCLYSIIRKRSDDSPWLWVGLVFFMCLLVLTRTIGLAMIVAMVIVALLDRELSGKRRILLLVSAITALVAQQVWGLFDPQSQESTYLTHLAPVLGHEGMSWSDRVIYFFGFVRANAAAMVYAWNQYFSLALVSGFYFWVTILLLLVCAVATAIRALKFRLDACYILIYVVVLLGWPYPEEMVRFIHPIVALALIQPLLLAFKSETPATGRILKPLMAFLLLAVLIHSTLAQARLYSLKSEALLKGTGIEHSIEYYVFPDREQADFQARVFRDVMDLMASTKAIVPDQSVVASAQHAAYSIIADRPAVMLSAIVSYEQQLCNFHLREVDYVFLAPVVNSYNLRGMDLLASYEALTTHVWTIAGNTGEPRAHLLKVDSEFISEALAESGFECLQARDRPAR